MLPNVVTVEDVVSSPMASTPLHRLDCCVVTDGGGALVVVAEDIATALDRDCVKVLGHGEAVERTRGGWQDITVTGGVRSGVDAFAEAGVRPTDIDYVGLYDSFTITVLLALEDLGFCARATAASSCSTARCSRRTVGCRSTPTGAAATTTRPIGAE